MGPGFLFRTMTMLLSGGGCMIMHDYLNILKIPDCTLKCANCNGM